MKPILFAVLLATLPLSLAAEDMTPVAEVTKRSTVPYVPEVTEGRYTTTISPGVDGAPEVLDMDVIVRIVDADDPSITRLAKVTGDVVNNDTPTGDKVVTFFDAE